MCVAAALQTNERLSCETASSHDPRAKRPPRGHHRGFPLSAWAFALRIWAAMMVGLYAAFWLQFESASSAAVTVGILALQTRLAPLCESYC